MVDLILYQRMTCYYYRSSGSTELRQPIGRITSVDVYRAIPQTSLYELVPMILQVFQSMAEIGLKWKVLPSQFGLSCLAIVEIYESIHLDWIL